jgi:hypothetical protein
MTADENGAFSKGSNIFHGETMLLAERTRKLTPPGTSKMRELANDLKRSGIDVINFAAQVEEGLHRMKRLFESFV